MALVEHELASLHPPEREAGPEAAVAAEREAVLEEELERWRHQLGPSSLAVYAWKSVLTVGLEQQLQTLRGRAREIGEERLVSLKRELGEACLFAARHKQVSLEQQAMEGAEAAQV